MPWPVSRQGEPAASPAWSESTASARPTSLREHGADIVVSDLAELLDDVIQHPAFAVEPWALRETELSLEVLAQSESVFALANGHIGLRANLDEGEPNGLPGTYLNGFYEARPLPYAEAGYGYPEAGQIVVNVTNGKIIRLLVDDEPFDVRFGELRSHERTLDFRAGVLRRDAEWLSPAGRQVRVSSVRLVSFVQRAVAAMLYEVEPLDGRGQARACSRSSSPTSRCRPSPDDPRAAASLASPLRSEQFSGRDAEGRARALDQGERAADGRRHGSRRRGPARHRDGAAESGEDLGRVTITAIVEPGQRLRLVKFMAYGWSSRRSTRGAARSGRRSAGRSARTTGWDGLLAGQRDYLDDFWERADVELEGDAELQQAVRFALFHTLQAGARGERRAIAAKGLTGPGYNGHAFWDTETFVLPVLTYTAPHAARDALRWRHATLGLARERARLARARRRRLSLAHDRRRGMLELLAGGNGRLPRQRGHRRRGRPLPGRDRGRRLRARGRARTARRDGATVALARPPRRRGTLSHRRRHRPRRIQRDRRQQRLHQPDGTTTICGRPPTRSNATRIAPPSSASTWRRRPPGATPPTPSSSPTTKRWASIPKPRASPTHQLWDFARTAPEHYPLLLHFPYFDLYRKQVVKQADLVLALHLRGDAFSAEEKARDFAYYEALTVRDSSLSACTQAVDRGRGRAPRARLRLLRRGRPDRPRQPRAQHPRRPPHRLAGRRLDRRCRRLRRHARPRRLAHLRPAPARATEPPGLRPLLSRTAAEGRGRTRSRRATRCSRERRSSSPTTARPSTSPERSR